MLMKKITTFIVLFLASIAVWAQGPNGTGTYYQSANGKSGQELKTALYNIIKNPDVDTYDQLWVDYKYADLKDNGYIWDIYSTKTDFTYYIHQQGVVKVTTENAGEGTCYNREHAFPKSWFGGIDALPMAADLTHVFPSDYYVNSRRNNYPYGPNKGDTYTSENGYSKFGPCTNGEYSGQVFEPNDELKGDLARVYFYMATCYEDAISTWTSVDGNKVGEVLSKDAYQPYNTWMMQMFLQWAKNDPVSKKEIARNNIVYKVQGNRNPFIDFPGLEEYIWGDKKETPIQYETYEGATYGGEVTVHPEEPYNPENDVPAKGEQVYKKVEWTGDLETGARYLLVFDGEEAKVAIGAAKRINSNEVRDNVAVEISDESFTTTTGEANKPYELILGGKRGEYTLYDPVAKNYVSINSDANMLHTLTSAETDNAKWTIKCEGGNIKVKNKAFARSVYYNVSSPRFASYTKGSQSVRNIQLYKNMTTTPTSIKPVFTTTSTNGRYYVYTIQGMMIRAADNYADAIQQLPRGIYIVNGKKFVVK